MKLPKITILLLVATFFFFIGTVVLLLRGNTQTGTLQDSSTTTDLTITQVTIASSSAEQKEVTDPIEITFSSPIKEEDVVISVSPPTVINIETQNQNKKLIIFPAQTWNYATKYTIKILKTTLSNGKQLDKDYIYQFETKPYRGI